MNLVSFFFQCKSSKIDAPQWQEEKSYKAKKKMIVQKLSGNLLLTIDPITNEEVILPKFELESDIKRIGVLFKRRQFPVTPAFVITANKSQEQTISGEVAIYVVDVDADADRSATATSQMRESSQRGRDNF